jgi:glycosyltransferase involved in cell wall biosynthesis
MKGLSVSVVTPNYNMGHYLPETIDSVVANLKPGDQYFVVDGGSSDNSVDVLRNRSAKISEWLSEPDRGYADALAKGFSRATGDILCWINSGDLLLAGALDAARDMMARTGSDMIFGDDFYIDEEGHVIFHSRGYVPDLLAAMLYGGWTPLQDACFWRRSLYERIGGINPEIKFAADYDLFLRMAQAGKTTYVSRAFSAFRRHRGQKSIAGSEQYRREKKRVRRLEMGKWDMSALVSFTRTLKYGTAIRWRERVLKRRWLRLDLAGQNIGELSCRSYWPP